MEQYLDCYYNDTVTKYETAYVISVPADRHMQSSTNINFILINGSMFRHTELSTINLTAISKSFLFSSSKSVIYIFPGEGWGEDDLS